MPRKILDGAKLDADVANLTAADRVSPPTARPSLMDAVRAFAGFIETRATLGWTDPMIAAVLTEAGYPIDPATLRSYRKRMRDEGLIGTGTKRVGTSAIGVTSPEPTGASPLREQGRIPATPSAADAGIPIPDSSPARAEPAARGPPDGSSSTRPRFKITQALPPDEA